MAKGKALARWRADPCRRKLDVYISTEAMALFDKAVARSSLPGRGVLIDWMCKRYITEDGLMRPPHPASK